MAFCGIEIDGMEADDMAQEGDSGWRQKTTAAEVAARAVEAKMDDGWWLAMEARGSVSGR